MTRVYGTNCATSGFGGHQAYDGFSGSRGITDMAESKSAAPRERLGAWDLVKRRFEIEFFALTNGITKRQTVELMKKFGEHDHETLVREARWLSE
jgi:hypothetical protein